MEISERVGSVETENTSKINNRYKDRIFMKPKRHAQKKNGKRT